MLEELVLPLPRSSRTTADAGDIPALVDLYASILFRVAHAVLRNRAEAEDAVQDTFVRVLQHQHDLPAVRDLRPWLIRITWNLAMDRCRARRRRTQPDRADDLFLQTLTGRNTPADQALHEAQQTRQVLHAIDRLPSPERQALLLSALDELSTPEIAHIMSKSESAVRARTHLRERLQKAGKR